MSYDENELPINPIENIPASVDKAIRADAHTAGRREAWEKMQWMCGGLKAVVISDEEYDYKCHWPAGVKPCTYDTCPLLQDGEK